MHRKAIFGAADGGEEQFVEALRAVSLEQQLPAGDGAGDGDAMRRRIVRWSGADGLIASSEAAAADRPEPLTATTLPPPGGA